MAYVLDNDDDVRDKRKHVDMTQHDIDASNRLRAKARRERKGMRRVNVDGHSLPGDRTNNTPSLRKDARFRNKLDLTAHPYKMEPNGICACVDKNNEPDIPFSLAVLQHYRHIMASRKPYNYMRKDDA